MKNHPKKGSIIKVEPIRSQADIDKIKTLLKHQPRNLALFALGINTNLRAGDLSRFKIRHMTGLQPGRSFEIKEKKTKKNRRITLNEAGYRAVQPLIESAENPDDPLFKSQRGSRALTVSSINRLVKSWCRQIGLKGNYGSHTLRKTWGYHAYMAGVDLPMLMTCFNHSTQRQTLDYLCIQDSQVQEVYLKVEL